MRIKGTDRPRRQAGRARFAVWTMSMPAPAAELVPNRFAVDREGMQPVRSPIRHAGVVSTRSTNSRELSPNHRLCPVLQDGGTGIVVTRFSADGVGGDVSVTRLRLDTLTGATTSLPDGAPSHARDRAIVAKGRARVVVTSDRGRLRHLAKPTGDGAWKLLREWDIHDEKGAAIGRGATARRIAHPPGLEDQAAAAPGLRRRGPPRADRARQEVPRRRSCPRPDVEWVEQPLEGHGWSLPATDVDFGSRLERFRGRHIGAPR